MDPHVEIAKFLRVIVNMANVPANDQFQNNLMAAKQWLDAIGKGALVVTQKPEQAPEAQPEEVKC